MAKNSPPKWRGPREDHKPLYKPKCYCLADQNWTGAAILDDNCRRANICRLRLEEDTSCPFSQAWSSLNVVPPTSPGLNWWPSVFSKVFASLEKGTWKPGRRPGSPQTSFSPHKGRVLFLAEQQERKQAGPGDPGSPNGGYREAAQ